MALDYEKIWGSNAAIQYTFSDIDYLKGWEFIGATPPARQQFDAWMRNADKKMLETHNDIVKAGNSLAAHNTDAAAHKPILDAIKAITGLDFGTAPSRTITNMITLIGQGGIVAARLSETGFVKFANGFTIQWGNTANDAGGGGATARFSIAFSNIFTAIASGNSISNLETGVAVISLNTNHMIIDVQTSSYLGAYRWVAVGIA